MPCWVFLEQIKVMRDHLIDWQVPEDLEKRTKQQRVKDVGMGIKSFRSWRCRGNTQAGFT